MARNHVRFWIWENFDKPCRRNLRRLCFYGTSCQLFTPLLYIQAGRQSTRSDDAILEMFKFYLGEDPGIDELEEWHYWCKHAENGKLLYSGHHTA